MFNHILDNDLYKFTMQDRILCMQDKLPRTVEYQLINRSVPDQLDPIFRSAKFWEAVKKLQATPTITLEEKDWLLKNTTLSGRYLDWLYAQKYPMQNCRIYDTLLIEGDWLDAILLEVPLMALISEMYYESLNIELDPVQLNNRLMPKQQILESVKFIDFGTRRRFSSEAHRCVNERIKQWKGYQGSSNVYLSMQNNLRPIGTIAHEWFMAHETNSIETINQIAWENWIKGRPDLEHTTAVLTDTLTTELFFKSVRPEYILDMMAYRQDSGEPIKFVQDLIMFHREHNALDTLKYKTVIFSDGLNTKKIEAIDIMIQLMDHPFEYKFGIGTNLTNDVGVAPLNIVIKPASFDGTPVCKISDTPGKTTGWRSSSWQTSIKDYLNESEE
jgi:nicotinate phosphoribosyltransferase